MKLQQQQQIRLPSLHPVRVSLTPPLFLHPIIHFSLIVPPPASLYNVHLSLVGFCFQLYLKTSLCFVSISIKWCVNKAGREAFMRQLRLIACTGCDPEPRLLYGARAWRFLFACHLDLLGLLWEVHPLVTWNFFSFLTPSALSTTLSKGWLSGSTEPYPIVTRVLLWGATLCPTDYILCVCCMSVLVCVCLCCMSTL